MRELAGEERAEGGDWDEDGEMEADDLFRRDRLLMGNLSWEGMVRVKNTEVKTP